MAGEITTSYGICLDIHPWSKTSHIVNWLTPAGKVSTIVKGALRAKSMFLGQYDLNYTCEILYYTNSKSDLHALRECSPVKLRAAMRDSYRALSLAGYVRNVVNALAPFGREAEDWFELADKTLDGISEAKETLLSLMVRFDLEILKLAGIEPDFSAFDNTAQYSEFSISEGRFVNKGKIMRISKNTAEYLSGNAGIEKNNEILLESCRVIGVYYTFHARPCLDLRRTALNLISK
jgi:DNA repair protein RecO